MRLKLVPSVRPDEVLEPDRCERQKRHHEPIPDQGGAPVGAKARVLPSRADQTEPGLDQALARDDPIKARLGISHEIAVAGDLAQPGPVAVGGQQRAHAGELEQGLGDGDRAPERLDMRQIPLNRLRGDLRRSLGRRIELTALLEIGQEVAVAALEVLPRDRRPEGRQRRPSSDPAWVGRPRPRPAGRPKASLRA